MSFRSIWLHRLALTVGVTALTAIPVTAQSSQLPSSQHLDEGQPVIPEQTPALNSVDSEEFQLKDNQGKVFFRISEVSGPAEVGLANHLSKINAVMYGAYWCPHCFEQLRLFGVEAIASLKIVECDPKGIRSYTDFCKQKFEQIQAQTGSSAGYPTWEIKGKFYSGVQTLETLAEISGYDGASEFQPPPPPAENQPSFRERYPNPPGQKFFPPPPSKVLGPRMEEIL